MGRSVALELLHLGGQENVAEPVQGKRLEVIFGEIEFESTAEVEKFSFDLRAGHLRDGASQLIDLGVGGEHFQVLEIKFD